VIDRLKEWIPQISRLVEPQPEPEAAATPADDPAPTPEPYVSPYGQPARSNAARKRAVVQLNHAPAADVAKTLSEFYAREGPSQAMSAYIAHASQAQVNVVAEPLTNSLIVSATPDTFAEITQMVAQLDQRLPSVTVRLLIVRVTAETKDFADVLDLSVPDDKPTTSKKGEGRSERALTASHITLKGLADRLAKTKGVELIAEPQIRTISNQSAFVQIGERLPTPKDGQSGYTYQNAGLTIGITPRVDAHQRVTMEIDVERSNVLPESQGVAVGVDAAGKTIRAPRIETTTAQTTITAADQQAVVLAGLKAQDEKNVSQLLIVVTPRILH
jgi:type II secretory pathway component GspD/PulD (secretin)